MIQRLRGTLLEKEPTRLVVEAGGVGYGVAVSPQTSGRLPPHGEEVDLYVHTHVYDGGIDLFGFGSAEDRAVFLSLTGVSKVGHKLAMTVLSGMDPDDLVDAIAQGDIARLVRIPGVGRKTAERMVVELKDRFGDLRRSRQASQTTTDEARTPTGQGGAGLLDDVRSALLNLGWKPANVAQVLPLLRRPADEGAEVSELIREGLRLLRKP
ncbi:MAG: Holliday junction branch migration protein RuvA [Polyangia bacterium]|nr:Holliday junction branch migration protein RuvA [Polyangia bacterium]